MLSKRYLIGIAQLLMVFCFGSCATIPPAKKIFPEFPKQNKQYSKVHLLTEMFILEDVPGKKDRIDLSKNHALAMKLLEVASSTLTAKGYFVGDKRLTSSGIYKDFTVEVFVINMLENKRPEYQQNQLYAPPFLLEKNFEDLKLQKRLSKFIKNIWSARKTEGSKNPIIPDVELFSYGEKEAVMLITAEGYSMPIGKQIGLSFLAALVGSMSSPSSWLCLSCSIVDAKTGELIWRDIKTYYPPTVQENSLLAATQDMFGRIIDYKLNEFPPDPKPSPPSRKRDSVGREY